MGLTRALAVLLAAALPSATVAAQTPGGVVQVRATVELDRSGDATVDVTYTFTPEGPDTIRFALIPFFGLGVADVSVMRAGARIVADAPDHRSLVVRRAGATRIGVRWRVPGAVVRDGQRSDLRVPIFLPEGPAAASGDDFFAAELRAPGHAVIESFPTVAAAGSAPGATHALMLPAAPSLLRWRLTTGPAPRFTTAGLVDAGLGLLLVLLAVLGVRALQRLPRES